MMFGKRKKDLENIIFNLKAELAHKQKEIYSRDYEDALITLKPAVREIVDFFEYIRDWEGNIDIIRTRHQAFRLQQMIDQAKLQYPQIDFNQMIFDCVSVNVPDAFCFRLLDYFIIDESETIQEMIK